MVCGFQTLPPNLNLFDVVISHVCLLLGGLSGYGYMVPRRGLTNADQPRQAPRDSAHDSVLYGSLELPALVYARVGAVAYAETTHTARKGESKQLHPA